MTESPLTRIPGAWADRHPVLVSIVIVAAVFTGILAIFTVGLALTAKL